MWAHMFGASHLCGPVSFGAIKSAGHRVWDLELPFKLFDISVLHTSTTSETYRPTHRNTSKYLHPPFELVPRFFTPSEVVSLFSSVVC